MRRVVLTAALVLATLVVWTGPAIKASQASTGTSPDQARSIAAFRDVASVLVSPRCLNCHVRGDHPRQGDDRHIHVPTVTRGPDGKGLKGLHCSNCHGQNNHESAGGPPGVPGWQMPSSNMPMAWEGLSTGDLCRSITDPKRNGHRTGKDVIDHMATQQVTWAWAPGPERSLPPLPYDQFMAKLHEWIDTGAVCEQ